MHSLKIAYIGQKGIAGITGGVETHVRELAFRMARAGHKVVVYARPYTAQLEGDVPPNLHLQFLPSVRTKHLDTITHTFLATLHAMFSGVDIIHYQSIGPSLLSFLPRIFRPSIRTIVTFHSVDREHGKWGRFAKAILHLAEWTAMSFPHATIVVSQAIATYAKNLYDKDAVVIPLGVVPPRVVPARAIQKEFGLATGEYALIVSRLISHKNIHLVIDAFKSVSTDIQLVIAGDASYTDRYESHLHDRAKGDRRVQFVGRQDGRVLEELFSNCLFSVNMSNSEGCPTATLEAMSYGKPVLLSDIPVNREVAGVYGTYAEQSVENIAVKIQELVQQRDALALCARDIQEYTLEAFGWDRVIRKTINLYYALHYHRPPEKMVESAV